MGENVNENESTFLQLCQLHAHTDNCASETAGNLCTWLSSPGDIQFIDRKENTHFPSVGPTALISKPQSPEPLLGK